MPAISPTLPAVPREDNDALIRKVAWRLMPLIMVCYLFAFFDRINISFARFQLQGALSLSDTAYGLGASLFVIGYVIFEVPGNLLLYRVGARRWIAGALRHRLLEPGLRRHRDEGTAGGGDAGAAPIRAAASSRARWSW